MRLWLSRPYLERVKVERVDPPAEHVELGPAGQTFVFGVGDEARPGAVVFYVAPEQAGLLRGEVALAGEAPLSFTQFVYP